MVWEVKANDIFNFICGWYELPPTEHPDHTLYASSPSERGWPQLLGVWQQLAPLVNVEHHYWEPSATVCWSVFGRKKELTMVQSNKLITMLIFNKISKYVNIRWSSYCIIQEVMIFFFTSTIKAPLWEWDESVSYFICIGHFLVIWVFFYSIKCLEM